MDTRSIANILLKRDFTPHGGKLQLNGDGARNLIQDLATSQQGDVGRAELMQELGRRENLVVSTEAAKILNDFVPKLKDSGGNQLGFETHGHGEFQRFTVRPDGKLDTAAQRKLDIRSTNEANGGRGLPLPPGGHAQLQEPGPGPDLQPLTQRE
jgi:hypothetical protein